MSTKASLSSNTASEFVGYSALYCWRECFMTRTWNWSSVERRQVGVAPWATGRHPGPSLCKQNSERNGENSGEAAGSKDLFQECLGGEFLQWIIHYLNILVIWRHSLGWSTSRDFLFIRTVVQGNKVLDSWLLEREHVVIWLVFLSGFAFSIVSDKWMLAS